MDLGNYVVNGSSEDITIGVASATHTTNFPANTTHVRLCATTACRVTSSAAGATAAVATDILVPANVVVILPTLAGHKITGIQESAAGKCNVLPLMRK